MKNGYQPDSFYGQDPRPYPLPVLNAGFVLPGLSIPWGMVCKKKCCKKYKEKGKKRCKKCPEKN